MSQRSSRRQRALRLDHSNSLLRDANHRHHPTTSTSTAVTRSSTGFPKHHVNLAAPTGSSSLSFDMLSVESTASSTVSSLAAPEAASKITSQSTEQPMTGTQAPATQSTNIDSSALSQVNETPATMEKPLQLQVQESTSTERTTLVVSPTFSAPVLPSSNPGLAPATFLSVATIGAASSSWSAVHSTTWTPPVPTVIHAPSASASSGPTANPAISHPHISPTLLVFMVVGGVASLGLSLYVFKRVRHRALHVSRSQFQITTASGAVLGSSSEKSFVSGGLGGGPPMKHEKNGYLDAGTETPLWGGKEKFSPQIDGVMDYPPAAYLADGSRAPMKHRLSMLQTIRRYTPGNRLSKSGPGWSAIPDHQDYSVPTVKVTDMDTRHNRLGSNSTFSSGVDGSPDPNSATIQVASVTRTLSAAASYRVGSPIPPPSSATGLHYPRPAPKVPSKALVLDRTPPVPRIPAATVASSEWIPNVIGKKLDASSRGKITVTDISKPQPVMPINPERAGETDPMVMYAKYAAGLDVREGSPRSEPARHESSMAKKIAQITHSKSTVMATESQVSLSNQDTRALAAAAGVGSPIPGEDHTFRGFDQNQRATGAPQLVTSAMASSSLFPASPGLGEVGNAMLRPYGEAGSMIPAFLETPAIGLDGRSSYLSTNMESGSGPMASPLQAVTAKDTLVILEPEQSAGALSPSMLSDDPSRRTIASAYSQDWIPLSQQAHMRQNPEYKSPTYSIYNYYGPDRGSAAPRVPSIVYGNREESQIGGAM